MVTMRIACAVWLGAVLTGGWAVAGAQKPDDKAKDQKVVVEGKPVDAPVATIGPEPDSATENTVTVGGQKIAYKAVAGTITVGYNDRSTRCWGSMANCWRTPA